MKNIVLILILYAALAFPSMVSGQAVVLKIDTVSVSCASMDTIKVPVRVRKFTNVGSFQFTITWDTTRLHLYNATDPIVNPLFLGSGANSGINVTSFVSQNPAKMTFNWTKVGGGTVPDETIIFTLPFKRLGGPFAPITMVNSPVVIEVTDAQGNDLPYNTIPGGVLPIDNIKPTIKCPADVAKMVAFPSPVNNIAPSNITDNCSINTVGWVSSGATTANFPTDPDASGAIFNFGVSTVTYTASDVGGNTATCSFKITLQPSSTSDTLTIFAQNSSASCGQNVSVNISALNFDSLGSLQFTMAFDTAVLKFVSVTDFNPLLNLAATNFGILSVVNGVVTFVWTTNQLAGTTLPQGASMFTLNFTVKGNSGAISPIQFTDIPTVREAYASGNGLPAEEPAIWVNGTVSIQDLLPPTLTCPPNVSVNAPSGSISAVVNNLQPLTLTDNCSGVVNLSYVRTGLTTGSGIGIANGTYNAGLTTVTYTAVDQAGNSSTCSVVVNINAGTPVTVSVDSLNSDCSSAGSQINPCVRVKDFADIVGLQFSVTWDPTVLQFNGTNNQYPGLNLTSGNFNGYANASTGLLQFFGGNASGWPNIPNGDQFFCIVFTVLNPNGSTGINLAPPFDAANSALDPVPFKPINGFFKSVDLTPPVITCPANITATAPLGSCTATVNIPSPQVSDACSGVQSVVKNPLSNAFNAGTSTVSFIATDNVGLTSVCSLTVTVNANSTPVLSSCPANISVDAQGANCSAKVGWQAPTAIDACGITPITPTANFAPNANFPVGVNTVTYVATDGQGNTSTCSFTVTVRDLQKPSITCPGSYVLPVDSSQCCAAGGFQMPTASDNCDQSLTLTSNFMPDDIFCIGTTEVDFTATDDFGNSASCTFTITVLDQYAPEVISCPADIVVSTSPNNCGATVNWDIPVFLDGCTDSLIIIHVYNPNTLFAIGTTVVEYYAADSSSNVAVCSFKVTVKDQTPPTISGCPGNITVQITGSQCDTILSWAAPLAIDNCPNITLSSLPAPNTPFPIGTSTIVYTAKDASGNTSTCTFTVNVSEKKPPVFTNCPGDFLMTNVDPCNARPPWTAFPSATDNCSAVTIDSSSYRPGDAFPVGTTKVTITATDGSGNVDTCSFIVTIIGTPPGFNNIPEDITKEGCAQAVTWSEPFVVGICNLDTVTSDHLPGDIFSPGSTVVTYTATDLNGTTVTTTFTINIIDNVPPVVICPDGPITVNIGGTILSDPSGFIISSDTVSTCDGVKLTFEQPVASDNCSNVSLEQTDGGVTGSTFPIGTQTLNFVATDEAGNTTLCAVDLEVQPIGALNPVSNPDPICSAGTVIITLNDIQDATYIWQGPSRNDTLSVNEYNVVIGKENNSYTVYAVVNGCKSAPETVNLLLINRPVITNDTIYVEAGKSDTFNILTNDVLTPGDLGNLSYQLDSIEGLKNLGNGKFVFTAANGTKTVKYFYTLCSAICDGLCAIQTATVLIIQIDQDCSFIPNTFTPNGDGLHELFEIPCIGLLEKPSSIVIYNQWGDKVFESNNYDNKWDGTLNGKGKPLPDGTYYYIFYPSNASGTTKKGFIQIVR